MRSPVSAPRDADGSMPSDPVSMAAQSERMSPNMLVVTMTSNCRGSRTSCMAALSASMCESSMSGYSSAPRRVISSRHRRGGLQDIGLVDRAHASVALAREVEGHASHAADLRRRVDEGVEAAALAATEILDAPGLAEIDAAGQFAHDHDVETRDDLRLQRRGVGERGVDDGGTEVREELHLLPEAEQRPLRPDGEIERVPTSVRPPHRRGTASTDFARSRVDSVSGVP